MTQLIVNEPVSELVNQLKTYLDPNLYNSGSDSTIPHFLTLRLLGKGFDANESLTLYNKDTAVTVIITDKYGEFKYNMPLKYKDNNVIKVERDNGISNVMTVNTYILYNFLYLFALEFFTTIGVIGQIKQNILMKGYSVGDMHDQRFMTYHDDYLTEYPYLYNFSLGILPILYNEYKSYVTKYSAEEYHILITKCISNLFSMRAISTKTISLLYLYNIFECYNIQRVGMVNNIYYNKLQVDDYWSGKTIVDYITHKHLLDESVPTYYNEPLLFKGHRRKVETSLDTMAKLETKLKQTFGKTSKAIKNGRYIIYINGDIIPGIFKSSLSSSVSQLEGDWKIKIAYQQYKDYTNCDINGYFPYLELNNKFKITSDMISTDTDGSITDIPGSSYVKLTYTKNSDGTYAYPKRIWDTTLPIVYNIEFNSEVDEDYEITPYAINNEIISLGITGWDDNIKSIEIIYPYFHDIRLLGVIDYENGNYKYRRFFNKPSHIKANSNYDTHSVDLYLVLDLGEVITSSKSQHQIYSFMEKELYTDFRYINNLEKMLSLPSNPLNIYLYYPDIDMATKTFNTSLEDSIYWSGIFNNFIKITTMENTDSLIYNNKKIYLI